MTDLETRLREVSAALPEPDDAATDRARAAMHAARAAVSQDPGARRSRLHRGPSRPLLLAAALAVVAAGGAIAASGWDVGDLPPFGRDDETAFVLPQTDILPGGYARTRPPRYDDLPERPSLLFPPGVGHSEAVKAYAAARADGEILPQGAELSDPLPAGKVALIRDDGRVAIDPAAPFGYAATSGLVTTLARPYTADPPLAIARCQLLIGQADAESPACDAPGTRSYVREGVAGRWLPSANEEDLEDPLVPASTELSVIDDPTTPLVRIPRAAVAPYRPGRTVPARPTGRLALDEDGVRLIVAALPGRNLCFIHQGRSGAGSLCGPRSSFLRRGAAFTGGRHMGGPVRLNGLVGDGTTRVATDDGRIIPIRNNVFTLSPADGVRRLTFSGTTGTFTVTLPTPESGRHTPDRTRERELVGIDLRGGGHASVRIAPNRGGGRCEWVYVNDNVRSSFCSRPSDPPLGYDVVTGGFIRRIDRVSDLFQDRKSVV
ncbi:MAG: hypothetical protein AB7V62_02250 [Thermoleophilia bacterium]